MFACGLRGIDGMYQKLAHIIDDLSTESDLVSVLSRIIDELITHIDADALSLFLVDEVKSDYVLVATHGLNTKAVLKARIPFGHGLIGTMALEEPQHIADAPNSPHYFSSTILKEQEMHGFLALPVIEHGVGLGALVVQQHAKEKFPEELVSELMTVNVHLAAELSKVHARGLWQSLFSTSRRGSSKHVLQGVVGSPGVALAKVVLVHPVVDLSKVPDKSITDIDAEIQLFEQALDSARQDIEDLQTMAEQSISSTENVLFDAYLRILDSRSLLNEIETEIEKGQWAQGALRIVMDRHISQLESLDDEYLKERATDIRDLGTRVLEKLQSVNKEPIKYPKNTILVCEEVTATALVEVPAANLKGVISGRGSSNSHAAILARSLGIPAIMGVGDTVLAQLDGAEVIIDGYLGQAHIRPSRTTKAEYKLLEQEEIQLDQDLEQLSDMAAETKDGHIVLMYVNTGLAIEAGLSLSVGAKGVGLYRTEMPFMLCDRFPSEEEQRVMYRQLLSSFAPYPVVMRTLDIGGDKTLSYYPIVEENPFLGWRGIRITLDHPELFLQQVRAMIIASQGFDNLSIMLPMVTTISEAERAKALIHQAYHDLKDDGLKVVMPQIGLMIEVPAAVYQAYELAKRVDFISVGSNDLIQYLLAVDRNNPRVASLYDGLHPAVLQALQQTVTAVHKAKKPISICGEMASDPSAVVVLLAMGFDALSMNAKSLLRMKWVIRSFSYKRAKEILTEVMRMDDAKEVRTTLDAALDKAGLGGLIRAGK